MTGYDLMTQEAKCRRPSSCTAEGEMGAWCEGCKHRYPSGKPKTFAELKALVESGDISVMLQEDLSDGTTRLLLCDYRQPWEKEVYEVIV